MYEDLFDETLGVFDTSPVHLELKPGAKPHHAAAHTVPQVHEAAFYKEILRLVDLGVLAWDNDSQWASGSFI